MKPTNKTQTQHSANITYIPPESTTGLPKKTKQRQNYTRHLPLILSALALICAIGLTSPLWIDNTTPLLDGTTTFVGKLESFGEGTATAFNDSFLQDEPTSTPEIKSPDVAIIRVDAVDDTIKDAVNTTVDIYNTTNTETTHINSTTPQKQYTTSSTFEQKMQNCLFKTKQHKVVVMCERDGTMHFVVKEPLELAVRYNANLTVADDRYFIIYDQDGKKHILELYK